MDTRDIPSIQTIDYVVFAASVGISLGIGAYYACKGGPRKTAEEYFVGSRNLNVLPVTLSLVVSYESSIMMLGIPAETFMFGAQFFLMYLGLFATLLFSTFAYVPMLHALKLTSVFEYLERRYNSQAVRLMGTILQTIYYLIYMGIVLLGPALALQSVTGFPLYISIVLIAISAIAYTSVGGIKAVVWTDLFQFILMTAGMVAIIVKGTIDVGGVAEVYKRNVDTGRLNFQFGLDPRIRLSFWTVGVSSMVRYMGQAFNQTSVQRISSMPTASAAKRAFGWSLPGAVMFGCLATMEGLVAYAYFDHIGCDPIASKRVQNPNQMVLVLVLELFQSYPGMMGLFLASLFSASLSTLSSGLGSVSTNFWEDIVKPMAKSIPQNKGTFVAKCAVVVAGLLSIGVSFLAGEVGGSLSEIANIFMGSIMAPMYALYIIAAMLPFVHSRGALIGAVVSFAVTCWVSFGKAFSLEEVDLPPLKHASTEFCYVNVTGATNMTTPMYSKVNESTTTYAENLGIAVLYTLSPYVYGPLGSVLAIVVAIIASFILGHRDSDKVDEIYLSRFALRMWCCTSVASKYIKKRKPVKPGEIKLLIAQRSYEKEYSDIDGNDGVLRRE